MTAAEKQTVEMLLELVKTNERANAEDHREIKVMIAELRCVVGKARDFTLSLKTVGKFVLGVFSTVVIVTGAVVGVQAIL